MSAMTRFFSSLRETLPAQRPGAGCGKEDHGAPQGAQLSIRNKDGGQH
jgi:hypothetical protein